MARRIALTGLGIAGLSIVLAACSGASGEGGENESSSGSGGSGSGSGSVSASSGSGGSGSGGFSGGGGSGSGGSSGSGSSGSGGSNGGSSGSGSSGSGSSGSGSGGSGSGSAGSGSSGSGSSGSGSGSGGASSGGSGGGSSSSGGGAHDAGSGSSPPARNSSCEPYSEMTGKAVDTSHGRMDGTLLYVLPMGGSSNCNGDDAHVHLQVQMNGSLYDVAIDIGSSGDDVGWFEQTMTLPDGAWSEGWHGSDSLGYSSLGLSSSAFTTVAPSGMGSKVEELLANTSKISIFCTGYTPEDNGCHDVHYQDGTSQDGAIALDPTSPTTPVLFFHFTDQSF